LGVGLGPQKGKALVPPLALALERRLGGVMACE
jgi:hypothetical protein